MVKSVFNKVAGLTAASILHLMIIFTKKLSRKKFLNRKKDTKNMTVATNRCLEKLQFYFGFYWKSNCQFSTF